MNIIVLCGGLSAERDVSLTTSSKVAAALRSRGHNAVLIDLFFGYKKNYNDPVEIFSHEQIEENSSVLENAPDLAKLKDIQKTNSGCRIGSNIIEICKVADIVFMGLHGEDGEDGKIQAVFDLHGIKYTGTGVVGSVVAMDKDIAKKLLLQNNIRTPIGITVHVEDKEYKNVGFPCVVKPKNGGSSIGTSIVYDSTTYTEALKKAFLCEDIAIVEQYIKGRECDVGVIAEQALPVIEICPKGGFYDYRNKYQAGLTDEYCPADLPEHVTEKLQETALNVFKALSFEVYGRMDFIIDEAEEIWCLEGNTLPGMTNTSLLPQEAAAAGISYEDLCELIVHESFKKYNYGRTK